MNDPLLAEVDRRIAAYQRVREALVAIAALPQIPAALDVITGFATRRPKGARGQTKKGRAKAGAGDDVILEVIRDGADTMNAIIAASKVKRHIANQAVRRLVAAKKVTKTGATKTLRYAAK